MRQLDELENKHRCQVERRNRLMKELTHLREVNRVYQVIDEEMYLTGSHSEREASKLSLISAQKIRHSLMPRSSFIKQGSKSAQNSPSHLSLRGTFRSKLSTSQEFKKGPSSCGSSSNLSESSKVLKSISNQSLNKLRASLRQTEAKLRQEQL